MLSGRLHLPGANPKNLTMDLSMDSHSYPGLISPTYSLQTLRPSSSPLAPRTATTRGL